MVPPAPKPIFRIQVREIIDFVLRSGDLVGEREFVGSDRLLAGTRGHQRVQRSRPAGYAKEVAVKHDIDAREFILRIGGRIDGLSTDANGVTVEEIKTVRKSWNGEANLLHWAQAKFYGFIYAGEKGLEKITLQLTYLDLETAHLTEFRTEITLVELTAFFEEVTGQYLEWFAEQFHWRQQPGMFFVESLEAIPVVQR